ncbi:MAG TPA: bifunctional homocysteine S-methyltransferase/methylenetetrahydrofolate reductase [Dehalococcoidia bacterium]|nr:bifunctional homocysteine S-methyltransferase/methylenetetrahydrofolate reductase [Dehalococcoidia bacterium]
MNNRFAERLAAGPIVTDGAMGTLLYSRGVSPETACEQLNLDDPALIDEIHRSYLRSGAELIETNTYGANRVHLSRLGLDRQVCAINQRGVEIAIRARDRYRREAFVGGSIGPLGEPLAPIGRLSRDEALAAFTEQIASLHEGGVDLLVFETFPSLPDLQIALEAAQEFDDLPIVAAVSFIDEDLTLAGATPEAVAIELAAWGVDALGVNCGLGPQATLDLVERMRAVTDRPIVAQPNAGLPARVSGRLAFLSSPEYFADYGRRMVAAGASIVGGCCGTGPEYISALAAAIRQVPEIPPARVHVVATPEQPPAQPAPAPVEESPLAAKLRRGRFTVAVELNPPRGLGAARALEHAKFLKEVGVDAINVADSPLGRVRMSGFALAALLQERLGVETILHVTTRDRNLIALQADLLGAHAFGVRNILALMGDPPAAGSLPAATGVWDVKPTGLIAMLKQFNAGNDWSGAPLGAEAHFLVGAVVNPMAANLDRELRVLRRKIEAGADFLISQPLYDRQVLDRFFDRAGTLPIPFIMGMMPLQSLRHAEHLHNEVPGIEIPAAALERMREAGSDGARVGLDLAQRFVSDVESLIGGLYIVPHLGRFQMVRDLTQALTGWEPRDTTFRAWSI